MIESVYRYTQTDEKALEKTVDDERVNINHIVVPPGEAVPPMRQTRTYISSLSAAP